MDIEISLVRKQWSLKAEARCEYFGKSHLNSNYQNSFLMVTIPNGYVKLAPQAGLLKKSERTKRDFTKHGWSLLGHRGETIFSEKLQSKK